MVHSGGRFKIVNVQGGTVVDLDTNDETTIHGCNFHGGDNQLWDFHQQEDGMWHIQNAQTGGYLAIDDNRQEDDVEARHSLVAFPWAVFQDQEDDSVWRIGVPDTAFHLDLSNHGDSTEGTLIKIWGAWEGRNQCWRIEEP